MTAKATTNPFRAPKTCDESTLTVTHVSCDSCDDTQLWDEALDPSAWSCQRCGEDGVPAWEHVSPKPLGYRDDKQCYWPGYAVDGRLVPDEWVYLARPPAAA